MVLAVALSAVAIAAPSHAESPRDAARALLQRYDQDPTRVDRARDLLEAAAVRDPSLDAASLITLARAWHLFAEERATIEAAKLAAWERGRAIAERAIALAPNDATAHLWYAIHLGSWAQAKGLLRSLLAFRRIREEVDTVLRLDPQSIEGHIIAGSIDRELPVVLGGDRARAEQHFTIALALDPHLTGTRIELAELYIKAGRHVEARRALEAVLNEPAPSDPPRWRLREAPRARRLLESLD